MEELTGETSDINYSCFFEVRGTPLLRQYVGRQSVPLFQGSNQPALAYSVFVGSAYFLDRRLTELRQGAYRAFHPVEAVYKRQGLQSHRSGDLRMQPQHLRLLQYVQGKTLRSAAAERGA